MVVVNCVSWRPGLQVVSLIELVRDVRGHGLLQAKREVEEFLAGAELKIVFLDETSAEEIEKRLQALGVTVESAASCRGLRDDC